MPLVFHAADESDTAALGAALAPLLPETAVVALRGTLGAGKTRLVQAIGESYGIDRSEVVSPTFVLVHEYHGSRPVFHFDAYRLADDDQFLQLGPEEYFERPGVSLVEWADRVERCLPAERLDVSIEITGESERMITIKPHGKQYAAVVKQLRAWATGRKA